MIRQSKSKFFDEINQGNARLVNFINQYDLQKDELFQKGIQKITNLVLEEVSDIENN